jgi:hypothetical protein
MQEDTKGEKLRYKTKAFVSGATGCYESGNNQSYSLIYPCLSVSVRGYFEIGIAAKRNKVLDSLKKTCVQ